MRSQGSAGRAFAVLIGIAAGIAQAATFKYNLDATGNWSEPANWVLTVGSGTPPPNAVDDVAYYNRDAGRTVTLDMSAAVGVVQCDVRQRWTIGVSGGSVLTLQKSSGTAEIKATASRGGMQVNPKVKLAGPLDVTHNGSDTAVNITLSGGVSGSGLLRLRALQGTGTGTSLTRVIANSNPINHTGELVLYANSGGTRDAQVQVDTSVGASVTKLTKTGNKLAYLAGAANAYTGGTFVDAGTLQVNSTSSLGAPGPLEIASGAKLTLNGSLGTVQGTVTSLKLGGVAQPAAGTYGSTASGADHANDTYFTGNGVVKLVVPGTVITLR